MYTTAPASITATDGGDITAGTDLRIIGHRHHIGLRQPADRQEADHQEADHREVVVIDLPKCLQEDSR